MSDLFKPNEVVERIMQAAKTVVPESLSDDVKRNVHAAIQEVVSDLDVVSREEFDVQKSVLLRTREKIDDMGVIIQELEGKIDALKK